MNTYVFEYVFTPDIMRTYFFNVKIIKIFFFSETYKKGQQRLKQAYKKNDIESTDDDSSLTRRNQEKWSECAIKQVLQKVPSMPVVHGEINGNNFYL